MSGAWPAAREIWPDHDASGLRDYVRKEWPQLAEALDHEVAQVVQEVNHAGCGESFCSACGDCLACNGEDPCRENADEQHSS